MIERLVANPKLLLTASALLVAVGYGAGFATRPIADGSLSTPRVDAASEAGVLILEPTPRPTVAIEFLVHVSGAVRNPGVYALRDGQRVQEAIVAAGGPAEGADPNALNLAAPLKDGQRIVVPVATIAPPPGVSVSAAPERGPMNINRASAAELETLPGIGPVIAQRIISYREESGGFRSVDELIEQKIVNAATLATQSRVVLRWTDADAAA